MTRPIAVAFALTLASFAQAMPLAPLHQQDNMIMTVREAMWGGYAHGEPYVRENSRPPCRQ
jgi:hypothetical protein